jgi:Ca2+-binding RTX toxin-like protein
MFRNVETLESRTLFAATPPVATIVQAGGVIDVVGTKKADDIHVRLSADLANVEVAHNGALLGTYALSSVTLVRVDAGKGHDHVHVDASVLVSTNLNGNVGNDILVGGGANDTLLGFAGKDNLSGGEGNDQLDGGAAPDVLTGGNGADNIAGGHGLDIIDGGAGADTITGGKGRDSLTGGTEADVFLGDDKVWELKDLSPEDSYTFNLNPIDIIDDFFGGFF